MKKILFLLMASGLALPVMAQKNKKSTKVANNATATAAPVNTENAERERTAIMSRMVGPMHHFMVQWAGHWREETSIFNAAGTKTGTYSSMRDGRMVMENRFLVTNIMGERTNMHYEAESVTGWDNGKMVFVKTWFDNTSTSILVLEGRLDEGKNIVEYTGSTIDPSTRQPIQIRQVLHLTDPTQQLLEIFINDKGREYKAMEVKSVRL